MRAARPYRYPLRLDRQDKKNIDEVVKSSSRSISQVLTLSLRKGLPLAREALCPDSQRVSNVEPLSDRVWKRIYSRKDEVDECSAEQIRLAQSQREPV